MSAAATGQHQLPTVNGLEPLASGAGSPLAITRVDWARGKASDWLRALLSRWRGGLPQDRGVSGGGAWAVARRGLRVLSARGGKRDVSSEPFLEGGCLFSWRI